jgi:hypothetical protein
MLGIAGQTCKALEPKYRFKTDKAVAGKLGHPTSLAQPASGSVLPLERRIKNRQIRLGEQENFHALLLIFRFFAFCRHFATGLCISSTDQEWRTVCFPPRGRIRKLRTGASLHATAFRGPIHEILHLMAVLPKDSQKL